MGRDVLRGGSGNDHIFAHSKPYDSQYNRGLQNTAEYAKPDHNGTGGDTLYGDAGNDRNDVFVLGTADEGRDIVRDFSFGSVSGARWYDGTDEGGNDRIRVDTATGSETTIDALKAAAQIRWTQDSNTSGTAANDTVIYATKGTADTSDDVEIMVLLDFTEELTMAMFEVV